MRIYIFFTTNTTFWLTFIQISQLLQAFPAVVRFYKHCGCVLWTIPSVNRGTEITLQFKAASCVRAELQERTLARVTVGDLWQDLSRPPSPKSPENRDTLCSGWCRSEREFVVLVACPVCTPTQRTTCPGWGRQCWTWTGRWPGGACGIADVATEGSDNNNSCIFLPVRFRPDKKCVQLLHLYN